MPRTSESYDVIVIGARCAGAATARLLAARGYQVALVDRAQMPTDTLSTHGLSRGAVVQLSRWGLLERVLESGAPAIREVSFSAGGSTFTRAVKNSAGVDLLVAPRRHHLDSILAHSAAEAGAHVLLGTSVTGLLRNHESRVTGVSVRSRDGRTQELHARYVVGADGLRSATADWVGAPITAAFEANVSLYYAYVDQTAWTGFEFYVSQGALAGVFPTHDGQACVWLSGPSHRLAPVRMAGSHRRDAWLDALRSAAPELAARVSAGRIASPVRGCIAPPNFVRRPWGPGWALVGDAGYHRDPITGHGITDALRDAELLADALSAALSGSADEAEALGAYEQTRDRLLDDTFRLTEALTRFPEPEQFVQLQIQLAQAIDREAHELAARPALAGDHPVLAA